MKIDSLPIPLRTIAYTLAPLGVIHITISYCAAIFYGDWQQINFFHTMALDVIWPELGRGTTNLLISQLFLLVPVFWFCYFMWQKKTAHKTKSEQ